MKFTLRQCVQLPLTQVERRPVPSDFGPKMRVARIVPLRALLEVPAAFIELNPNMFATEEELIDYCKGKIASFKVPRHVRFVDEWPMSSTKVQKFRLLEQFEA